MTGKVYSCGWNHKGQLGLGHFNDKSIFQAVELPCNVKLIFAFWDTSAAVLSNGDLYVWGNNMFFNIGCDKCLPNPTRIKLPNNKLVLKVSSEFNYFYVLSEDNNVFRVRKCTGELNFHHLMNGSKFSKIYGSKFENNVLDIASGQSHTIFLIKDNIIIGVGENKFGQASTIELNRMPILKMLCGWKYNAVLDNDGNLFMWGRNNFGQLGIGKFSEVEEILKKIHLNKKITDFNLGSEHGICCDADNIVYSWGWNEHGNCGNGKTSNMYVKNAIIYIKFNH